MENTQYSIPGKILIHIAFFYKPEKFEYLRRIIENFKTYRFSEINIVVDTNSGETEKQLQIQPAFDAGRVRYEVHKDLSNWDYLTYKHRNAMAKNLQNYDYFMYTEDDLLIPWTAIQKWHEDTSVIYPLGFVRGFTRVERGAKGELVCIDVFFRTDKRKTVITLQGKKYFYPPNPYQAFWIYSKRQMEDFIRHRSWIDGNHLWGPKPCAAAGMAWIKPDMHRSVIPLDENDRIAEEVLVYHLPNNYALRPDHSHVPLDKIFLSRVRIFVDRAILLMFAFFGKGLALIFGRNRPIRDALKKVWLKIQDLFPVGEHWTSGPNQRFITTAKKKERHG